MAELDRVRNGLFFFRRGEQAAKRYKKVSFLAYDPFGRAADCHTERAGLSSPVVVLRLTEDYNYIILVNLFFPPAWASYNER